MKKILFATTKLQQLRTYAPNMFGFSYSNSEITSDSYDCAPVELKGHEWGKIGRLRCRT